MLDPEMCSDRLRSVYVVQPVGGGGSKRTQYNSHEFIYYTLCWFMIEANFPVTLTWSAIFLLVNTG